MTSVADPGYLSDPGSWILPIPDPGSRISDPGSKNSNKREGWKKICCHNFLCSHKFHKIAHYFSFDVLKKKIWANFQRIIELFTQKIINKLSKLWIWDPGSGIRDPGSRGQKGTGSRIRIRNTGTRILTCFRRLITQPGTFFGPFCTWMASKFAKNDEWLKYILYRFKSGHEKVKLHISLNFLSVTFFRIKFSATALENSSN